MTNAMGSGSNFDFLRDHDPVFVQLETTAELAVRDVDQYLSQCSRVLDYFDAVRVWTQPQPALAGQAQV